MKIKFNVILLITFLLLVSSGLSAQDNAYIKNKIKLPPSPNAAALGKYGEVPISQFTGMANISIPLFEIKSGTLSAPINLSYHYSGFKIDDRASWTGNGWVINAGGVITRVIQGLPDESTVGYTNIMGNGGAVTVPDPITDRTNFLNLPNQLTTVQKNNFARGFWDSLQDIYYFNFMGRSGKIIFTNKGVFTVPYQALKIEQTAGNWIITDEAGVKYVFGISEGRNGIETTEYDDTDTPPGSPIIPVSKTSWYLVDMISPNGDVIKFDYAAEGLNVLGQDSQTKYYYTGTTGGGGWEASACAALQTPVSSSGTHMFINAKRLLKIKFADGEVNFVADTLRKDVFLGDQVKRLDKVVLTNSGNAVVRKFNFGYSYMGQSNLNTSSEIFNRLVMNSVTEEGANGVKNKPYQFFYIAGTMPSSKTYSIDHWGYYNGRLNGANLIPQKLGSLYDRYFQTSLSSREPDSVYASLGLMTKIIYPTGGTSEFQYERQDFSNTNGSDYPGEYKKISDYKTANVSIPANGANTVKEQVIPFTLGFAQEIALNYRIQRTNANGRGEYYVSLLKDGQALPVFTYSGEDQSPRVEYLNLAAGNYRIIAHIEDKGYSADINLTYEGYDYSVFIKNKYASGFRIKKVVNDQINDNSPKEILNYIYTLESDNGKSSGILNAAPSYEYHAKKTGSNALSPGNEEFGECQCSYIARTSNSIAPLGASDGGIVTYSQVKIVRDNGQNGSTRSWFTSANDFPDQIFTEPPLAPTQSQAYKRGLLVKEVQYDKNGRIMQKLSNDYEYNTLSTSPNLYGMGVLSVCFYERYTVGPANPPSTYTAVIYDNRSAWQYLKKATRIVYNYSVGGVADSVITATDYIYSNPLHTQLTENRTVNSKSQTISTLYRYPHELVASGKIEPYQEMINRHMFAVPIEQEQQLNSLKQNLQLTQYKRGWAANSNLILPDSIKTQFKTDPVESRFRYLDYDDHGNPVSVMQEKGMKICYIWGYGKSIPIAEISNADYATVQAVLGAAAINTFSNKILPTDAEVVAFLTPLRTDVRLKDAQITSCTYAPLTGMTSSTDAKGMTTYYEYDGLQRLMNVKDQDLYIIKNFDYHYKP